MEQKEGLLDASRPSYDLNSPTEDGLFAREEHFRRQSRRAQLISLISIIVNVVTVGIILILVLQPRTVVQPSGDSVPARSQYANLAEDFPMPWVASSEYSSDNETETDRLWGALRADDGIVALDKKWAAAQGLPPSSSPFPWDGDKSIYLINAYHEIHCLAMLHLSLREYRDGKPQSHSFEHNNHCLDWLRNDIMCRADDTPLYATNSHKSENGIGQYRQCRDWSKLEDWVRSNTACYRYGNFTVEDQLESQLDRFRFCPDDSPYLDRVRAYYGKGDDWFPTHDDIITFD